ncbi:hypothetical protein Hanom_Chr15g01353091 [Helianthus anomalus]
MSMKYIQKSGVLLSLACVSFQLVSSQKIIMGSALSYFIFILTILPCTFKKRHSKHFK